MKTTDSFPALVTVPGIRHFFTHRATKPAIERHGNNEAFLSTLGWPAKAWKLAEQTHGDGVAVVDLSSASITAKVDALCTKETGVALGIYVADCGAIYVVDPVNKAIGLAHSGRKGTELNILGSLLQTMTMQYGSRPEDLVVQLSPCIRPPHYEVDFAAAILEQARNAGVKQVHDCGICTASQLDRYFSYRAEKGNTGRMLAGLMLG